MSLDVLFVVRPRLNGIQVQGSSTQAGQSYDDVDATSHSGRCSYIGKCKCKAKGSLEAINHASHVNLDIKDFTNNFSFFPFFSVILSLFFSDAGRLAFCGIDFDFCVNIIIGVVLLLLAVPVLLAACSSCLLLVCFVVTCLLIRLMNIVCCYAVYVNGGKLCMYCMYVE